MKEDQLMSNKYFSKALLYDERNNTYFMISLCGIFYLFNFFAFFASYYNTGYYTFSTIFSINGAFPIIFLLVGLFESYSHKSDKYSLMLTQPYKRDTIIITKFISYFIGIAVPLLAYGLLSSIIVFIFNGSFSVEGKYTLGTLWRNLFLLILICSLISAFVQFLQTLFGKSFMAFLLPFLLIFVAIPLIFTALIPLTSGKIPFLKTFLIYLTDNFLPNTFQSFMVYIMNPNDLLINKVVIVFAILLLTLAFLAASILLNRRIKFESISDLFMFGCVRTIFKIVCAILAACITVLLVLVITALIAVKLELGHFSSFINQDIILLFVDCILVAISILYYRLFNKIEKRRDLSC